MTKRKKIKAPVALVARLNRRLEEEALEAFIANPPDEMRIETHDGGRAQVFRLPPRPRGRLGLRHR